MDGTWRGNIQLPLIMDNHEVCSLQSSRVSSGLEAQWTTEGTFSLMHLFTFPSLTHFSTLLTVSWAHLPNN